MQGTAIDQQGAGQVWTKPLAGGDVAVALLNRGSEALRITISARKAGLARARAWRLENLWSRTTRTTTGAISARVRPDSVVLYRVTPV